MATEPEDMALSQRYLKAVKLLQLLCMLFPTGCQSFPIKASLFRSIEPGRAKASDKVETEMGVPDQIPCHTNLRLAVSLSLLAKDITSFSTLLRQLSRLETLK